MAVWFHIYSSRLRNIRSWNCIFGTRQNDVGSKCYDDKAYTQMHLRRGNENDDGKKCFNSKAYTEMHLKRKKGVGRRSRMRRRRTLIRDKEEKKANTTDSSSSSGTESARGEYEEEKDRKKKTTKNDSLPFLLKVPAGQEAQEDVKATPVTSMRLMRMG